MLEGRGGDFCPTTVSILTWRFADSLESFVESLNPWSFISRTDCNLEDVMKVIDIVGQDCHVLALYFEQMAR